MFNPNAYKGARRLLDVCAALQPGESVAVVTDTRKAGLAGLIAGEAAAQGAEPTILTMAPRRVDGAEPTSLVGAAMRHANVVVLAGTYSLAHSRSTRAALEHGARVVSVTNVTEELLAAGGLFADFYALRPACRALAEIFTAGRELHITAPGGTDITVPIAGREGNAHDCLADLPGMFTAVPNIEANVAPVEGGAEGRIVFDASIPNLMIGVLDEPVTVDVRSGMIRDIVGGRQARSLAHALAGQDDRSVYNLAQVAVGLNPECRTVTGQMTNDHGVLGTMHFGIGTSRNLGGETEASMHIDGILWSPTIAVDDQVILEDGKPVGAWANGLVG